MTQDVIALTPKMPEMRTLLAGLYAGGPELRVDSVSEGAAIRLCASDGRPVATVEVPLLLRVPGETSRLLGAGVRAEAPTWWTEVRATTAFEEAGRLAGSVAGRLTTVLGGTTWPPEAAHTDVVPIPSHGYEPHGYEAPVDADHPLDVDIDVDVLTEQAAVVIQDRPVAAATTWLTELLRLEPRIEAERLPGASRAEGTATLRTSRFRFCLVRARGPGACHPMPIRNLGPWRCGYEEPDIPRSRTRHTGTPRSHRISCFAG
ncbi:DUF6177 family protein [Streptomyces avermitilis]